jgi:putative NIF3 family GTP cyclohydrolase 1 type 2
VDAGRVPFTRAAAAGVDFLIVHHGLYWTPPQPLVGAHYARFATALHANLAVYSCHLPLDGHPELGNNPLLARQLGLTPDATFLTPPDSEPVACSAPYSGDRARLRAERLMNENQNDALMRTRTSTVVVREKALALVKSGK